MNTLFPLPFVEFLKIVFRNGGFSRQGWLHAPQWIVGTTLFEPLRWIELAAMARRIREHKLEQAPVFILGYYRSGTTYLQELFRCDERLGWMSSFQSVFPDIMLTGEKWMTPIFEFFSRISHQQNVFHRIPFTWHSVAEEDIALCTSLSPRAAHWGYFFPEKMPEYYRKFVLFEGITEVEREAWKRDYLLLCKKISLANRGKRLVLKNPPNTARIKLLLSLFPDARFVHIHRDPYEVYASTLKLLHDLDRTYALGSARNADHAKMVMETYPLTMQRYLEERSLIPAGRLVEIAYSDFISKPVKTMQSIYENLQLGDFRVCETKMRAYAEQQKSYRVLKHELSGDLIQKISDAWGPVIIQLGYPVC